jgi:hypothetical protein
MARSLHKRSLGMNSPFAFSASLPYFPEKVKVTHLHRAPVPSSLRMS